MPHKQKYGKSKKADLTSKRSGWSDMSDGTERHEYGYKEGFGDVGERKYKKRAGWSDTHEGSDIRPLKYRNAGGNAGNKEKFSKRDGWSDHRYQDGGIVREAKKSALMDLKSKMNEIGGNSLLSSFSNDENAYKNGGVVKATVMAKDPSQLKEGLMKAAEMMEDYDHDEDDYDEYSKEELIEMLKRR